MLAFQEIAPGTAIAATCLTSTDIRIYFQDAGDGVRELYYSSSGWSSGDGYSAKFQSMPHSPIAVAEWYDGTRYIRLYTLDKENNLTEHCMDGQGWYSGYLSSNKLKAAPYSKISAFKWETYLRVYYQKSDNDIQELCPASPQWTNGQTMPRVSNEHPLPGTDITSLCLDWGKIRVYYQGADNYIWEAKDDNGWSVQKESIYAKKYSPLAAITWTDSTGRRIRLYGLDDKNQIVEWCKDGDATQFSIGNLTVQYIQAAPNSKLSAIYWDSKIRIYFHSDSNTMQEWCNDLGSNWCKGFTYHSHTMTNYKSWMNDLRTQIGSKKLREVALPGTHDSGTYGIMPDSPVGMDWPSWAVYLDALPVAKLVMALWAVSQGSNFAAQLASGIRYFDLRVQGGSLNFVHGLVGSPITELLDQLNDFLSQSESNKEIVLLDFNHFYNMTPTTHKQLVEKLKAKFGNKLAPESLGTDVTVNKLWESTYRIIVLYNDSDTVSSHNCLWSQTKISSPWPNTQDITTLFITLQNEVVKAKSTFFVLQGVLTPNAEIIAAGLIPLTANPSSLFALAIPVNAYLISYLTSDEWKNKGINIVICDWANSSYVDAVIKLNT
ncbi:PLC-like phosphodiesterase [Hysterangium stoloniferum]|nr:PLC-like phosphodiesterase [Hysterangium stoloniferum]